MQKKNMQQLLFLLNKFCQLKGIIRRVHFLIYIFSNELCVDMSISKIDVELL